MRVSVRILAPLIPLSHQAPGAIKLRLPQTPLGPGSPTLRAPPLVVAARIGIVAPSERGDGVKLVGLGWPAQCRQAAPGSGGRAKSAATPPGGAPPTRWARCPQAGRTPAARSRRPWRRGRWGNFCRMRTATATRRGGPATASVPPRGTTPGPAVPRPSRPKPGGRRSPASWPRSGRRRPRRGGRAR